MKICVIGLGKIGLPLAVHFAKMGNSVIGSDINKATVDLINSGNEPFPEEENLQQFLGEVIRSKKLSATTDNMDAVSKSDVVVVVVPLFVDANANPDFKAMDAVTRDIGKALRKGMLISYETTLPIGTTRERFLPVLEELSGLKAGIDFNLVFSPERVLTGRVFSDLRKYPKIVGGVTQSCTQAGVKLAETTYRDVNIGLANQFAKFALNHDLDIRSIISASNSQPYSHIHTPGISVGGHCIPIYPQFYLWNDPEATIVRAARNANKSMPEFFVHNLEEKLGNLEGKSILVLGVSYRDKVKETAFTGAYDVRDALLARKAIPSFIDPLYSQEELNLLGFTSEFDPIEIEGIILHTDHEEFKALDVSTYPNSKAFINGRDFA